jgi:hypothetical protein
MKTPLPIETEAKLLQAASELESLAHGLPQTQRAPMRSVDKRCRQAHRRSPWSESWKQS